MKGYVVSGYSTLLYKGFRLRKEKTKNAEIGCDA